MFINIIKYGISEGVAKLAPFLTTLYVAKFLSPELFGKYSLIGAMFEIAFIFISFNIQATTRIDYFKEDEASFNRIKQNHLIISLSITMLGLFALLFIDEANGLVIAILLIAALMRTGSVFLLAMFQCAKQVNYYIVINVVFILALSVATFIFIHLGASFYSWLYAMLLASSIQFALAVRLFGIKRFRNFLTISTDYSALKATFTPAALFMPQAIGWWLKSGADKAIIAEQLGSATLGNFSLAYQLASFLLIVVGVVNLALVPELNNKLRNNQPQQVIDYIKYSAIFIASIALVVFVIGQFVLTKFYKGDYPQALNIFHFLIFAIFPQALMLLVINVLYYKGEGRFVSKLIFVSFLLQVTINYFYIKIYGVIGLVVNSFLINLCVFAWAAVKSKALLAGNGD